MPFSPTRRASLVAAFVLALLVLPAAAQAAGKPLPGARISTKAFSQPATYPGMQHLHYEYGPIKINPGAEHHRLRRQQSQAERPRLHHALPARTSSTRRNHTIPRVDVIHLHHGVWLINGYPTFAAGEEKTVFTASRRATASTTTRATAGS